MADENVIESTPEDSVLDAAEEQETVEEEIDGKMVVTKHETPVIIQNHVTIPKYSSPDVRVPIEFKPAVTITASQYELARTKAVIAQAIILGVIAATLIVGLFIR